MDSTYAPQSPDLSSFLSPKPAPPPPPPSSQDQSYRPQQTREDSFRRPSSPAAASYQPSSYAPRSPTLPFTQHPAQSQGQHHDHHPDEQHRSYSLGERGFSDFSNSSTQYMPPIPALPPADAPSYSSAPTSAPYYAHPIKAEAPLSYHPYDSHPYNPTPASSMSRAPRGSRVKDEQLPPSSLHASAPPATGKAPPPSVDIRTKFPVARIKRIMQADEEVGKVAQVTPVAVNKALELFMTALVLGAAEKAREKGGKRITAGHLKSVVEADEQFDFLTEIVGRVQESAEGEKKRKGAGKDSDSDDDSGERKVKKGKGRRKKGDE